MTTIAEFAARRGQSTEDLFLEAYQKERGPTLGLADPKTVHAQWKSGWAYAPAYISTFMLRHKDDPVEIQPDLFA